MLKISSKHKMFRNIVLAVMLFLFFIPEFANAVEIKKGTELIAYKYPRYRRYYRRHYYYKKQEEKQYIVSLDVTGNTALQKEEILRNAATQVGEFVNQEKLKRDIKKIMDLGYFKDVKVEFNKVTNGYVLMFRVIENEKIPTINITGNTVLSKEEIMNIMKSKAGDVVSLAIVR